MSVRNGPQQSSILAPRKYSERLGVIDGGQLQAVADEFGLGRIINAEPAQIGLFGQVLFLTTTAGQYVMRGNPHGHVQLTKERLVAKIIHERSSLAAPWPYQVSENTERFGWTYAVMPKLPGTIGSQLWNTADEPTRTALAIAFGKALGRLHETTSPFFGPYDPGVDDFVAMDDFPDWALQRFDESRTACRRINALTADAERFIDTVLEDAAPALGEPFAPVLVHHDFQWGNLTLAQDHGGFVPSGVFDLFESYFGDPEEDLVRMVRQLPTKDHRRAFVAAYTEQRPLRPGVRQRIGLYALADFLIVWEYGRRNKVWFEDVEFARTADMIIANAQEACATPAG